MKKMISAALIGTFVTTSMASSLALAAGTQDDVKRALDVGTEYGITHFHSIELDDDPNDFAEVEGWLDEQWYVELEINPDGTIHKEERHKRNGGPWGLSADQTMEYLNAASERGLDQIEEIKMNKRGSVEIEGRHTNGRELELDYEQGNMEPVKEDLD
ncbi:hypothetical protein [Marinimicrobium sp. ARAG 43.8]|uniref:hypothetical protein n=1 Tax=Marinimicrobium sp. ARAG 43.8 TaxID=3418719 RepID=UPI003CF6EDAB